MFNSNKVNQISSQKHLGTVLDETSFEEHLRILSVKNQQKTLSFTETPESSAKACFNYIVQIVYKTLS